MHSVVLAAISMTSGVIVAALPILAIVRDERRPMSALEAMRGDGIDWDAELAESVRSEERG